MAFFEDLFADLTQCADTSDLDGLPTLDFDCSTLTTTTTTTSLEPGTTITPSMDTIPISIAPDANQVPFYQGSDTQSDEIKNLLTAMSSRLTDLEMAVSAGNAQISQVGFNLDMALPRVLGLADEFRSAVDALRNSVKDFARGLINHLLTCRIEGDVETGIVT